MSNLNPTKGQGSVPAVANTQPSEQPAPQPVALPLTIEQVIAAVVAATQAAGVQGLDVAQLGQVIGDAVAAGIAKTQPRRKMTVGEYEARLAAQNPNMLTRPVFQNGLGAKLSQEQILLANRITHSGRYCNRLVEVIVTGHGDQQEIHLRYSNRTPDHRFAMKDHVRGMTDMLTQIVEAQERETRERLGRKAERDEELHLSV